MDIPLNPYEANWQTFEITGEIHFWQEEAARTFGLVVRFAGLDAPASNKITPTQERLDWHPSRTTFAGNLEMTFNIPTV